MEAAEPVVVGDDVDGAPEAAVNAVVDSNTGHVFTDDAGNDVDDSINGNAAEPLPGSDDGTAAAQDNGGAIVTDGDAAMANEHGHSYQQHHGHKWRSEHHHKAHEHAHPPKARGSEQVSPPADGAAVSEDSGSAAAVAPAPGISDDPTPAFEPNVEPSQGSEWVADFADFSAAPPAADAADVEWGSPMAFTADGGSDFGEWGAAPFGAAQAVPPPLLPVAEEVKTADPLLAAW